VSSAAPITNPWRQRLKGWVWS